MSFDANGKQQMILAEIDERFVKKCQGALVMYCYQHIMEEIK